MAHEEMGFHLAHGVQEDADQDEHAGTAKELSNRIGDVHLVVHEDGNDGDDGQEDGPSQSDPTHRVMEIIAGGLSGAHAWDITAVFIRK